MFVLNIYTLKEIAEVLEKIFSILQTLSDLLKKGDLVNSIQKGINNSESDYSKGNDILSLKAAAWIARVITNGAGTGSINENIYTHYKEKKKMKLLSFKVMI